MMHAKYLILFALSLSVASLAADRVGLDSYVVLPGARLRLRPLEGLVNSPLPTTRAFTYVKRPSGEKFEALEPHALWLRDQRLAIFKGPIGTMTIGTMAYNVLPNLPLINGQHIRQQDFELIRDRHESTWEREDSLRWIAAFVGQAPTQTATELPGLTIVGGYVAFEFPGPGYNRGFLLLPNAQKIFVLIQIPNPERYSGLEKSVYRCLKSVATTQREMRNLTAMSRFQDRRTATQTDRSRDEFQEARQRVIRNIQNLENWWFVETPNYIVAADLTSRDRALVKDIQTDIESLRSAYATLFPPLKPITDVSVIRVFAERQDYVNYVAESAKWSGGLWMPSRKELVISSVDANSSRARRETMLQIVYHEGFHQYLYYALDQLQPPIWFNEGHATLFESAEISGSNRISLSENPSRVSIVEQLLEHDAHLDLASLMRMTQPEFYAAQLGHGEAGDQARLANYAVAWALVYFFRKAGPLYGDRPYAQVCPAVVRELIKTGGDQQAASEAGLALLDMPQLQRDFTDFWTSKSKRRRAERNELFGR